MFRRPAFFDRALTALREENYRVISVDARTDASLRRDFTAGLEWERQFGYAPWTGNLNALHDALAFEEIFTDVAGVVFAISRYDLLNDRDPKSAWAILDLIETNSRYHLIDGRRLLAFVQTDDPLFTATGLGAGMAWWNGEEARLQDRQQGG